MRDFTTEISAYFSTELLDKSLNHRKSAMMAGLIIGTYIVNARGIGIGNMILDDIYPAHRSADRKEAAKSLSWLARQNLASTASKLGDRCLTITAIDDNARPITAITNISGRRQPTHTVSGVNDKLNHPAYQLAPSTDDQLLRIYPEVPKPRQSAQAWADIQVVDVDNYEPLVEIEVISRQELAKLRRTD